MEKPQLAPKQQVEHLESKGVTFDIMTKEEAVQYLMSNNNYFKLRSYRENFMKRGNRENKEKYMNLDFAMLKDLAIIDMRLRYCLLLMALDIEHFSKVMLLNVLVSKDDGYVVVKEYMESLK